MSVTTGYRRKPIWIYIVAGLLVLTPFVHVMGTLREAGEPLWYSPFAWWVWIRHLDLAPVMISSLLCLAGLAILTVQRWSWWFGITVLSVLCVYNVFLIRHTYADDIFTQMVATFGSLLLLGLLYFSEFKKPFLNRRLRWWESEPRFRVGVPVQIHGGVAAKVAAMLVDISRSGIHLEPPADLTALALPREIVVEVNSELKLPCRYSRSTPRGGSAYKITAISRPHARYLRRWLRLLSRDPSRLVR